MKALLDAKYKNLYETGTLESSEGRAIGANGIVANIKRLIAGNRIESILEIGFGDGAVLNSLSQQKIGKFLFGLEIADSLVQLVNNLELKNLVSCTKFDGYNIEYPDDKFDLVILSHVIEHVEHPRVLINEAKRVGKQIIFEVPLEDTIRLKKDFVLTSNGHINFFSYKIFRNLVQSCELVIVGERLSNPSFQLYRIRGGVKNIIRYFLREYLLLLLNSRSTRLFTYHYTILCSK